jgi:hypothetical protein
VPAEDVVVVVGCAADWGCDCEVGGEFVWAALAVAGGVEMPFVSGAGDAMVEEVVWCSGLSEVSGRAAHQVALRARLGVVAAL